MSNGGKALFQAAKQLSIFDTTQYLNFERTRGIISARMCQIYVLWHVRSKQQQEELLAKAYIQTVFTLCSVDSEYSSALFPCLKCLRAEVPLMDTPTKVAVGEDSLKVAHGCD